MTPEMEALGRRAVARGWMWTRTRGAIAEIPGWGRASVAAIVDGAPVWVGECGDGVCREWEITNKEERRAVPDLSDPATLGCLWSLVGDPGAPMDAAVLVGMLEGKS